MRPGQQLGGPSTSVTANVDEGVEVADTNRLPLPIAENYQWQGQAACRGMDSAKFFHPEEERNSARRARIAEAKAICGVCPALMECRAHALEAREPYGIWGGLSEGERATVLGLHSLRYPGRADNSERPGIERSAG